MPGIIYKFENQNLVRFEDNIKYCGDLPFAASIDFETTTSSGSRNHLEDKEMYQVFYCLIYAFHLKLDIN